MSTIRRDCASESAGGVKILDEHTAAARRAIDGIVDVMEQPGPSRAKAWSQLL